MYPSAYARAAVAGSPPHLVATMAFVGARHPLYLVTPGPVEADSGLSEGLRLPPSKFLYLPHRSLRAARDHPAGPACGLP